MMWMVILWASFVLFGASLIYLGTRILNFLDPETIVRWSKVQLFLFSSFITLGAMGIITLAIDFVNAILCIMYMAMIWMLSDFVFGIIQKIGHLSFHHYYAGWTALIIGVLVLMVGWHLNHKVVQTDYFLTTSKEMPDLKIAMFADAHIGTTFDAEGFAKHLAKIQEQKPDLIVVVGDYVDDGTSREQMVKATEALGKIKTKYGIFFVFGNHDKGYYGAAHRGFSERDLIKELSENKIVVLRDEAILLDNAFYVIGRRDFSEEKEQRKHRLSMDELTAKLDKNKYMIVLDHQPTDYAAQAESGVDLVLNGHTHGGQLFPFNQIGKWIGANDSIYGHEKRDKTDFIVTSGISDWAIQFKTGTRSEFVIIHIKSLAKKIPLSNN